MTEALKTLKAKGATVWTEAKVIKAANASTGASAKNLSDAVSALNHDQAEAMAKKIMEAIEAS